MRRLPVARMVAGAEGAIGDGKRRTDAVSWLDRKRVREVLRNVSEGGGEGSRLMRDWFNLLL